MDSAARVPIVTVIGSGDPDHPHAELAAAVGRLIAEMGFHLLTGGGLGAMRDACRGFAAVAGRRGVSIGVIPRALAGEDPKPGYPNPWVEIPILTHLAGRLGPEGAREGTRAEIRLARRHGKPILAVLDADRLEEERSLIRFLEELRVPRQPVRRLGQGWDLGAVRSFLISPRELSSPGSAGAL